MKITVILLALSSVVFCNSLNPDTRQIDSIYSVIAKLEVVERANKANDSASSLNSILLMNRLSNLRLQAELLKYKNINVGGPNTALISSAGSKIKISVLASVVASVLSTTAMMAESDEKAFALSISAIICSVVSIQQLWSAGSDLEKSKY
ncbi:MAG: hypothetical protein JNL74_08805 [Fibrobacteres bacterium]|nr:hypothetical protein [Fibrobacterota bacterium]